MQTQNNTYLEQLDRTWNVFGFWRWFRQVNQTSIGLRYIVTAFIFFLAAGILALLMRLQLAFSHNTFLGPDFYNQAFTMHGTVMMFLFAIPIVEGLAVYFVPLMIGTRDLAFPRLSAFSYYVFLIGGIVLWIAFFLGMAPDAGWFSYPTLVLKEFSPSHRIDVYATVITFIEVSALAAAVELTVTILRQRAPGMSLERTPPFVWSILVTMWMIVFAMPGVIVGSIMLAIDRLLGSVFFLPAAGGDVLLWQHLFWWFGHPEVYIIFLPATGIISTVIPVFCRRRLFGYTAVIVSIIATGVISFGLWVHHMFMTGIPVYANSFFTAASAMVALPTGIQMFCWLATIVGGRPIFKTPFLFSLGFIVLMVIGGLTGVMVASVPFDRQVHDSYFLVAHFHYVLIGGTVFPFFAGFYYWWPKMTGRMLSEYLGKIVFWLMFIGFNVAFFPMHILGFLGMPRRIYTYPQGLGWEDLNLLSTVGAFLLGIGVLLFVTNAVWSLKRGPRAIQNPWNADTLEWSTAPIPPNYKFEPIPRVESLTPLWDNPQPLPAVKGLRIDRREVVVTSMVDAKIEGVVQLPGPSIWPFVLAAASAVAFVGSIFHPLWFVAGFCAAVVAAVGWFWPPMPWDAGRDKAKDPIETSEDKLPIDVSGWTRFHSDRKHPFWWGIIGLIVVEMAVVAAFLVSFFYLWLVNVAEGRMGWPPAGTAQPPLLYPTINLGLLLICGWSMWYGGVVMKKGQHMRFAWLAALCCAASGLVLWLRWLQFLEFPFKIGDSAYASFFWVLTGFHFVHVVSALVGTAVIGWLAAKGYYNVQRQLGIQIDTMYWYFVVLVWVPIYVVLYILPRIFG